MAVAAHLLGSGRGMCGQAAVLRCLNRAGNRSPANQCRHAAIPARAPSSAPRQEAFFHYLFGVPDREDCWGALDLRTQRAMLFIPR